MGEFFSQYWYLLFGALLVGWVVWLRWLSPILAGVKNISMAEYKERFHRTPHLLLDVRTENEFAQGHAPRAQLIPGDKLARQIHDFVQTMPAGKPVVCICASGSRSAVAATALAKKGIKPIYNLSGGMGAWIQAKMPIKKGDIS